MEVGLLFFIFLIIIIVVLSINHTLKEKREKKYYCFIDKLLSPFSYIKNMFFDDTSLHIDLIGKDYIKINTNSHFLYGISLNNKLIKNSFLEELYLKYNINENANFYRVIFYSKKEKYEYIFSPSEQIINEFEEKYQLKRLSGIDLAKILKRIIFLDEHKKRLDIRDSINLEKKELFNKLSLYQGYKAKTKYDKINKNMFFQDMVVWFSYDLFIGHINRYISKNFKENKTELPNNLILLNFILISSKKPLSMINEISDFYKISLVEKAMHKEAMIIKTPLKYKNPDWDLLIDIYSLEEILLKGYEI